VRFIEFVLFRHCVVTGVFSKTEYNDDRDQLKCNGTRAETRFRLSAKRTSPFH